jgi:aspartate aminotransferase
MQLSNRVMGIAPSLTLKISAMEKELKGQGRDVVGFGAGEPDFDTPQFIKNAAKAALDKGLTKYTPAEGTKELKEAIAARLLAKNGLSYAPDCITVNNGAKHSLFNVCQAILNPGDECLLPAPYWLTYPELVKMADAVPVYVETTEENGFLASAADLNKALTKKTKALILNSPSNPCGCVYGREELMAIADFAVKNDLYVISDEIYDELIYGGREHVSIASLGEEIKKRTILVNGMSKAFSMTGWRIGYTASEKELAKAMGSYQSHATSNPNSIAQYASVAALKGPQDFIVQMREAFEKRRNLMYEMINAIPGLSCRMPDGAFYIMVNISGVIGRTYEGKPITGSLDFSEMLLSATLTAVVPGVAFGADRFVRLSYATSEEKIKKGIERIGEFIDMLD